MKQLISLFFSLAGLWIIIFLRVCTSIKCAILQIHQFLWVLQPLQLLFKLITLFWRTLHLLTHFFKGFVEFIVIVIHILVANMSSGLSVRTRAFISAIGCFLRLEFTTTKLKIKTLPCNCSTSMGNFRFSQIRSHLNHLIFFLLHNSLWSNTSLLNLDLQFVISNLKFVNSIPYSTQSLRSHTWCCYIWGRQLNEKFIFQNLCFVLKYVITNNIYLENSLLWFYLHRDGWVCLNHSLIWPNNVILWGCSFHLIGHV